MLELVGARSRDRLCRTIELGTYVAWEGPEGGLVAMAGSAHPPGYRISGLPAAPKDGLASRLIRVIVQNPREANAVP
jgi:hypothetical protein